MDLNENNIVAQPMNGDTASPKPRRFVEISRASMGMAMQQAEAAVDYIMEELRKAEARRDSLAHEIGAQQDMIARMVDERDRRTHHVRELKAAHEASRT